MRISFTLFRPQGPSLSSFALKDVVALRVLAACSTAIALQQGLPQDRAESNEEKKVKIFLPHSSPRRDFFAQCPGQKAWFCLKVFFPVSWQLQLCIWGLFASKSHEKKEGKEKKDKLAHLWVPSSSFDSPLQYTSFSLLLFSLPRVIFCIFLKIV